MNNKDVFVFASALVLFSILIKFISGYIGARFIKMDSDNAKIFASSLIPQLSTTLAVATIGTELNIIDEKLFTSIIFISIVTVLVSPLLISLYVNKVKKKEFNSAKI